MTTRTFALLAVLAAPAAFAQWHDAYGHAEPGCDGPQPPVQANTQPGRWELQTVQRWVPGQQVTEWVPGECRRHGWRTRCREARQVVRTLPGHYESRQEWVWVAGAPRPVLPHAAVTVRPGRVGFSWSM